MKIAIDINDVVRDFSNNFLKIYCTSYNREFDTSGFEFWTNDMQKVFPFRSESSYNHFVYSENTYELFGKVDTCSRNLDGALSKWIDDTLKSVEVKIDEPIEVIFVSSMEYGSSIGYTYFFLSKINTHVRETYFPADSSLIWNKCDVLITANPDLIRMKPENKKVVKIKAEYNEDVECEYSYPSLDSFISDENNIYKILTDYA